MADLHANFAWSTVATAPSPAASGTSLVVATGEGARFPTPPFNATIWPTASQPLTTNGEIVRVTAIVVDTFTITRTQENTSARTILISDQIAATITTLTLTDIEAAASVADSKAVSDSVVTSTLQTTSDSKDVSQSVLISTADSKGVSDSVVISTNLTVANSKDVSQSVLASTADSKGVSGGTRASVADSKALSCSLNTSTVLSRCVSRAGC